jgi:hypothetical protein
LLPLTVKPPWPSGAIVPAEVCPSPQAMVAVYEPAALAAVAAVYGSAMSLKPATGALNGTPSVGWMPLPCAKLICESSTTVSVTVAGLEKTPAPFFAWYVKLSCPRKPKSGA